MSEYYTELHGQSDFDKRRDVSEYRINMAVIIALGMITLAFVLSGNNYLGLDYFNSQCVAPNL